eukprot:COSAG02_NODE_6140_length_3774_cov_5.563537_1_plen_199_part_00
MLLTLMTALTVMAPLTSSATVTIKTWDNLDCSGTPKSTTVFEDLREGCLTDRAVQGYKFGQHIPDPKMKSTGIVASQMAIHGNRVMSMLYTDAQCTHAADSVHWMWKIAQAQTGASDFVMSLAAAGCSYPDMLNAQGRVASEMEAGLCYRTLDCPLTDGSEMVIIEEEESSGWWASLEPSGGSSHLYPVEKVSHNPAR